MEYAVSMGGLVVHSRQDWPCAVCRPWEILETRHFALCRRCAHGLLTAAQAGSQGARDLLDDLTDALGILECNPTPGPTAVN